MLYHYTTREAAEDIIRDGRIKAHASVLYQDMLRQGPSLTTEPIVWLTINPILDMTVLVKLGLTTPGANPIQRLCRFVLPDGYAGDLGLGDYTEQVGIDYDWWICVVQTGEMAGSNYTTWRIVPHDIPASDWLRVERVHAITESGIDWRTKE